MGMGPARIQDEFAGLPTRQDRWRARQMAQGRCTACTAPARGSRRFCRACLKKHRVQVQAWRARFAKMIQTSSKEKKNKA